MARKTERPCAFALPLLGVDLLEPRDGTSTGSTYTEADPRPGTATPADARSRLVPIVSGEQGQDLEVVPLRAGLPGVSDTAAQLGYRPVGGELRGYNLPNVLTGWSSPVWTTDPMGSRPCSIATLPRSQRVVVVSDYDSETRVFDPATATWTDGGTVGGYARGMAVLLALPTGRLVRLLGETAYRSDDEGESWTVHAAGLPLASTTTTGRASAARSTAGDVLLVGAETDGTLYQGASQDDLATLTVIGTSSSGLGTSVQVAAVGDAFVVACLDDDGFPVVRRVGSAFEPVYDVDPVIVDEVECDSLALCADPDGVLWLHAALVEESLAQVRVWCSTDGGSTWTELPEGAWAGANDVDKVVLHGSTASCGTVHVLHSATGVGSARGGSLGVMRFGGWSTFTALWPSYFDNDTARIEAEASWLARAGTGVSSEEPPGCTVWIPIEQPQNAGWDDHGSGTEDWTSDGRLEITSGTGSDNRWYSTYLTSTPDHEAFAAAELAVVSGGSLSANHVVLRIQTGSGSGDTWGADLSVRFTETGFAAVDEVGAVTLASATVDTSDPIQVAMWVRYDSGTGPTATVIYKRPADTAWTVLCDASALSDAGNPVDDDAVAWGNMFAAVAVSRWSWVIAGTQLVLDNGDPVGGELGEPASGLVGRPIGVLPVPLPSETGTDQGPAWLSANAGPAVLREVYSVPAAYDHAIENLDPTLSPSPARTWRSLLAVGDDGPNEVVLAFDHPDGRRFWPGDAVGMFVSGANWRIAALESYDPDEEEWTEVAGVDLGTGFEGLSATVRGTLVVPADDTTNGSRFVAEGELVGGSVWLTLDGEEVPKPRKILSNTSGTWSPSSDASPKVRLTIEADGNEEDTDGVARLVWPAGFTVVPFGELTHPRRWRLRIPQQHTYDGHFQAGILSVMQIRALGAPHDWGWSTEYKPNSETRRTRRGTSRTRTLGPTVRSVSASWVSGVDQRDLRRWPSVVLDHLSTASGALPLAVAEDVEAVLAGILEQTGSGAIPLVWLPALPAVSAGSAVTLTDPSLFLYGRFATTVSSEHLGGPAHGVSGVFRIASIEVEGLV